MYTIDEELVMTLRSYLWTLMSVISTIIVISGVTPVFTFCLIPIIVFYIMQQKFFTVCYYVGSSPGSCYPSYVVARIRIGN